MFQQPLGALIFFIAATAEANRTPFDLTEADSEIVAGFATEYSGMRFGFFFFAEYVNVFVISALIVTLFFGGWNAPFPWPLADHAQPRPGSARDHAADPDRRRAGHRDARSSPRRSSSPAARCPRGRRSSSASSCSTSLAVAAILGMAYVSFDWVAGLLWFLGKTYGFVFLFVWMRGTLPRVRIDQLMGFAWKWLLPASLLNLFVTALAILVVNPA